MFTVSIIRLIKTQNCIKMVRTLARIGLSCLIFIIVFTDCKSKSHLSGPQGNAGVAGPRAIVYKTTSNYFLHVPVILSQDKKSVVSFPAPSDVYFNGDFAYPVKLENGYLLDRRGISEGCAFLKWTYYEYSRLDHTPGQEELLKMILDPDPLAEMYDCGRKSKFNDIEAELNRVIREGKLGLYEKIK